MKWSWFGRVVLALISAVSLGLGMTACGGGIVGYIWAVGTTASGSGQIVGYKIDNFTGNLTAIPGQPFSSVGSNPVQVVVRPGGRFVYVINQGTGASGSSAGTAEGINEFSVGGEGTLTLQNQYDTNGRQHMWATFDTSGGYLFVLDKYSPTYQPDPTKPNYDPNGAISTFSSDPTTGRLQLQNQTNFTLPGQPAPLFVEVGASPRRMLTAGSCLFTLNDTGQTVTPYSVSTAGQLATVTTGTFPLINSGAATNIAGNGTYIGIPGTSPQGTSQVLNYTVSNCALTAFTQNAASGLTGGAINPTNVFVSTSGKYVYVLNANNTNTQTNAVGSTVSGFTINATAGQLQELSGSPFPVGAGPQCMVEDPTSKYVYTSNQTDGTITGFIYSDTTGQLAPLSRGSRFTTSVQNLGCLAVSGAV